MPSAVLITSEHGGNRVPAKYRSLFVGAEKTLASHRGYDLGSLPLAQALATAAGAPLIATQVTRLLVEVNRSPGHPRLLSEFTASLSRAEQQELLAAYYHPHRMQIEQAITKLLPKTSPVLHIGMHTFTPELNGQVRTADVGLLYDPTRAGEAVFARLWRDEWRKLAPELRIRRNYPYLGKSDGLVTYLRRIFPAERYIGIELEVNQQLATGAAGIKRKLTAAMTASFATARQAFSR